MLLAGVAVFSYVMGNFIEMLHKSRKLNDELEQGDLFATFLNVMIKFNKNFPLSYSTSIEQYFKYRWKKNRNWALEDEADIAIFD